MACDLSLQQPAQAPGEPFDVSRLASPDDENPPAEAPQCGAVAEIARGIAFEFPEPKGAVGGGCGRLAAAPVPVPEAAVDENHDAPRAEHDVRPSWQAGAVQPEPQTHRVKQAPDDELGFGVLVADARHVPRTALFGQAVTAGGVTGTGMFG
jgi:hypothetical protein